MLWTKRRVRSIFISDCHLGLGKTHASELVEFLKRTECEWLYLVGDIVDPVHCADPEAWETDETYAFRTITALAETDIKIRITPGNHDEHLQNAVGIHEGTLAIDKAFVHQGLDGKKYLVIHGDQFDDELTHADPFYGWKSRVYTAACEMDRKQANYLAELGAKGESLIKKIKNLSGVVRRRKEAFIEQAIETGRSLGCDGVICGHIHAPALEVEEDGFAYMNCGDWLEHATAIIEDEHGQFELVHWNRVFAEDL